MEQPTPRVALGQALRGLATSAIDISDGLLGDLGHVLRASGQGACNDTTIANNKIATQPDWTGAEATFDTETRLGLVLAGGDDYELAFTAPAASRAAVQAAAQAAGTPVTRIGRIEAQPGVRLVGAGGQLIERRYASFDHFARV